MFVILDYSIANGECQLKIKYKNITKWYELEEADNLFGENEIDKKFEIYLNKKGV